MLKSHKTTLLFLQTLGFVMFVWSDTTHLVTYNTGLTSRVAEYERRRYEIGPALSDIQADVVCLQEVWSSTDMFHILETTNRTLPYSYSILHDDDGQMARVSSMEAPCRSLLFVTTFLPCIAWFCSGISEELDYLSCAKQRCGLLERVDQECITCIILSGSTQWKTSCLYITGNRFNMYGLLMLSNRPLRDARVTRYVPNRPLLLPRAYIAAEIDGIGTVVCTHTTADLGPLYYEDLDYRSWEEQNVAEARTLVTYLQNTRPAVVMGDINSSPRVTVSGVEADFDGNYELIITALEGAYEHFRRHGYSTPYVDRIGICTWCLYNRLLKATQNMILDHVFVKNLTVIAVRRLFDDNLEGHNFPLSDHYGLGVTVNHD